MNLNSLEALLASELQDIYDAELRIVAALPEMSGAATNADLKEALDVHLEESKKHLERLHLVFNLVGAQPEGKTCEAAKGLLREGDEVINATGEPAVKDAALIGAAQRVEHYEMAAYGTACALAKQLDFEEAAALLHETLEEEKSADEKLTKLAMGGVFTSGINKQADATAR